MEGMEVESQNLTNFDMFNESLVPKTTHTNLDQSPNFENILKTTPKNKNRYLKLNEERGNALLEGELKKMALIGNFSSEGQGRWFGTN